jgi:hypothetical protein
VQILSVIFLILRKIQPIIIINLHVSLYKVRVKFEFSLQIFEKFSNLELHKMHAWEPSCFKGTVRQTNEQKYITKLIVVFRNFSKAPKEISELPYVAFAT